MKLTIAQKTALKSLKKGAIIETDGVTAEIVSGKNRKTLQIPTFRILENLNFIEKFHERNIGVIIESYRIKN